MSIYENIVEDLYNNQFAYGLKEQRALCDKGKYILLLNKVKQVLNNNKDASLEEIRRILLDNSKLTKEIEHFIIDKKMAPGLVVSYGTPHFMETITIGNRQEVTMQNGILIPNKKEMTEDTIFDLASVTKLFTAISILKLREMNLINLDDDVIKYAPQFINLKGVTINDLLSFIPIKTTERVDRASSIEEAENILFQAVLEDRDKNKNSYNDFAPMVLKYIIEKASGKPYKEFLLNDVLVDLNNTCVDVSKTNIANGNYDGRYFKDGSFIIRDKAILGVSTDDKARILGQPNGNLAGHAGLFSNAHDLNELAKRIIEGSIINSDSRDLMAINRTGHSYVDDTLKYTQYLGYLCYLKNPIQGNSEVYHPLSNKTISSAGWSGTYQTIDPLNKIYLTYLSNRTHNRMTFIDNSKKDLVTTKNDVRSVILPNGMEMIDSTRYAWERDIVIHKALDLTLEYLILEKIMGINNYDENHILIKK